MSLPDDHRISLFQRLQQDLKSDLIAGLLVVIPLATTIWLSLAIARWVIDFLTSIPKQLNPLHELNPFLGDAINLGLGLAVPLFSLILIGLMARNIVGRFLLDFGERTLKSIPLAGSVYTTLKQLLETLLQSNNRFRRVVLLEYPRPGIWAIAFVTGSVTGGLNPTPEQAMASVFIPTTPNPTTGWYAIVPESDMVATSLSVEDAFKVLISGGIVSPDGERPGAPPAASGSREPETPVNALGAGQGEPLNQLLASHPLANPLGEIERQPLPLEEEPS
jgi:uncharacterized membrane protein